ncbi:VOC family protein [Sphingobacterium spiritivorum]|uniref:VOC family protein n=1 Tax=Sphingobacterium spiritivorum TaxID=258 RepID=UPI003DA66E90
MSFFITNLILSAKVNELINPYGMKQMMYPCLWFEGNATEAVDFYISVFKDSRILSANPLVTFLEIKGQKFMALNGRPDFEPNQASSLVIECSSQDEIDQYWEAITKEGEESMCGWCKDKYGFSWQIIPENIEKLLFHSANAERAVQAMMGMKKIDIAALENA